MGQLLTIPIIGWIFAPIFAAFVAIPFYVLWNWCGINQFFTFLPAKFIDISFLQTIGLFLVLSILKLVILPHSIHTAKET